MRTVKLLDWERDLARRKAALGYAGYNFVTPNSGVARKSEKRNLLRRLFELMRAEGRTPPFSANF